MALIFLNPIHRLYGNNLRTLRTRRSLLKTYNPKKTFTHILFGEGAEGKGGQRSSDDDSGVVCAGEPHQ